MKTRTTIIAIVAVIHFLVSLALLAILKVTGFTLITLFGPTPSLSRVQSVIFDVFAIALYPMAWLPIPDSLLNWFAMPLLMAGNSTAWGVCFGFLIHAARRRGHREL